MKVIWPWFEHLGNPEQIKANTFPWVIVYYASSILGSILVGNSIYHLPSNCQTCPNLGKYTFAGIGKIAYQHGIGQITYRYWWNCLPPLLAKTLPVMAKLPIGIGEIAYGYWWIWHSIHINHAYPYCQHSETAYRYWQIHLQVLAKSSTGIDEIVYQGKELAFSQYRYMILSIPSKFYHRFFDCIKFVVTMEILIYIHDISWMNNWHI